MRKPTLKGFFILLINFPYNNHIGFVKIVEPVKHAYLQMMQMLSNLQALQVYIPLIHMGQIPPELK